MSCFSCRRSKRFRAGTASVQPAKSSSNGMPPSVSTARLCLPRNSTATCLTLLEYSPGRSSSRSSAAGGAVASPTLPRRPSLLPRRDPSSPACARTGSPTPQASGVPRLPLGSLQKIGSHYTKQPIHETHSRHDSWASSFSTTVERGFEC